jgi:hypothetical protein
MAKFVSRHFNVSDLPKSSLYMNTFSIHRMIPMTFGLAFAIAWQPLFALAFDHSSPSFSQPASNKISSPKSKRKRFLAQANLKQVNDTFFAKVQTVAKGFEDYSKEHGRFPEFFGYGGGQMVYVLQDSLRGNLDNPYYDDRIRLVPDGKLRDQMTGEVDFRFFADDKLNDDKVETYRTNPPADWLGVPGIIVGVGSKDESMVLFFGVGPDGKPLREPTGDGLPGPVRFAVAKRNK